MDLALHYCNSSPIVADECAVEMLVLGKYKEEPEMFENFSWIWSLRWKPKE